MRCDYFYHLPSHHRPVNDLSTAVKLTNTLLRFWADGGFVYYTKEKSLQSVFSCLVPIPYRNITSWFAIAGWDKNYGRKDFKRKGGLQPVYWLKGNVTHSLKLSTYEKNVSHTRRPLVSLYSFMTSSMFSVSPVWWIKHSVNIEQILMQILQTRINK